MDTGTLQQLRKRIAEYRRLRTMTWDKQALEAISRIIAEAEDQLRKLSFTPARDRVD